MRPGVRFASSVVLLTAVFAASAHAKGSGVTPKSGTPPADVGALVGAEKAFCAMALEKGIRDAFFANLSDHSIIFRPGPVNGHDFYQAKPSNAVPQLWWEPEYAELAASGELGWTTGPWEFRPGRGKDPVAFGHFATVWQKQADGTWKALIDQGHEHAKEANYLALTYVKHGETKGGPATALAAKEAGVAEKALADADAAYNMALGGKGLASALGASADPDVRLCRDGHAPVRGRDAAAKAFADEWKDGVATFDTKVGAVSRSGDLAFTYGTAKPKPASAEATAVERSVFRVWRRSGSGPWKLALDVTNPFPPAPPPPPPAGAASKS